MDPSTVPVIRGLSAPDRKTFFDRAVLRAIEPDDIIHLAGDPAGRVHIVVRGVVKLSARDADGNETILGLAVPGAVLGETAVMDGSPQPLDSIASTPGHVLGIDGDLFVELVFRNPVAAFELARAVAARTRWMVETAIERTSGEVCARLAGRLLDLAALLGRDDGQAIELELPLGQRDLGRLAGVCRESTCKTLRRLKAQGIVDYHGRRLRILRPDSLQLLRCGAGGRRV